MTTQLRCPHCRQKYKVPHQKLGQDIVCKKCGRKFALVVPEPDEPKPKLPVAAIGEINSSQWEPASLWQDTSFVWRALVTLLIVGIGAWDVWQLPLAVALKVVVFAIVLAFSSLLAALSCWWCLFSRLSALVTRPAGWAALILLGWSSLIVGLPALLAVVWGGFRSDRNRAAYMWSPPKQWRFLAVTILLHVFLAFLSYSTD